MKNKTRIGIAGNPNCGKTTVFNGLTGGKQSVGNWPGVTVDRKEGRYSYNGKTVEIVDLPGIYSLSASSLDEKIAGDYILREKPDLIVNILDASNLERNLYLTVQLIEMKIPVVIVLNMMDLAGQKGIAIDTAALAGLLDCPVTTTVAKKGRGIEELKKAIDGALQNRHVAPDNVYFPEEVESAVRDIISILKGRAQAGGDTRWAATKILEGETDLKGEGMPVKLREAVAGHRERISGILGEEAEIIIADSRYGFINAVCKKTVKRAYAVRRTVTDLIDRIALNRFLGIPLFLTAMYLTFWVTINLGGCFIEFFDRAAGTIFVDGVRFVLGKTGAPALVVTFLADGIGGGIRTVATFIPPVFFMFLCLAVLEDSGYMARAAFVMDRLMRFIGLPGKAFVPMMIGFGCTVPAIMAARTLDNERDRVLTIMMNPFMSCGARMPVYAVFTAAFFPETGNMVIFTLYITGAALAVMTAFILKKTVLKGEASTFIMELPPYHMPALKGILVHTWNRLKSFIFRAGKAIVLVVIVLSFLNATGAGGADGRGVGKATVLTRIGKGLVPVFKPMGITEENWPAAVGIFAGIFSKEAVIGTLASLYPAMEKKDSRQAEEKQGESFSFYAGIKKAFNTIPENLLKLKAPFWFSREKNEGKGSDVSGLRAGRETYGALRRYFDGRAGAFAYLLMILLYMPCVAAIAAVYKELNWQWTLFSIGYMSALAWMSAVLFYQIARFGQHPASSSGWIVFTAAGFFLIIAVLGKRGAVIRDS
ncbi:MAG: Fe(2+) transporter permease subunit FeoB [Candidatus Omnitrophota bacterium]